MTKGIVVVLVLVLFIAIAALSLEKFSELSVKKGDQFMTDGEFKKALVEYQSAQKYWPFLAKKESLQYKMRYATQLKDEPQMVIFLKDGTAQSRVEELMQKIQQFPGVGQVKYVSKEEALKRYLEHVKEQVLKDLVTADILPASIEVYLESAESSNEIETMSKGDPIVDQVITTKVDVKNFEFVDKK